MVFPDAGSAVKMAEIPLTMSRQDFLKAMEEKSQPQVNRRLFVYRQMGGISLMN
jgi:hypothetical protein